jgi:hypothetical protein
MVPQETPLSRVIVFGLDNYSVGEFESIFSRGWGLAGTPSTSGGASTTIVIPDVVAAQPWLQLGRMVMVDDPPLPPWTGVLDTPWTATLPVKLTVYDAPYLLALRVPDTSVNLIGDIPTILAQVLDIANRQEDLYIRVGETQSIASAQKAKKFEQRPLWEQINNFGIETGTEMILRPKREGRKLMLYLDLSVKFGQDVNYLLYDGQNGNMRITSASVEGPIRNRVIGITSQSSSESRLSTIAYLDEASKTTYRLRSHVEQFRDISAQAILDANAQQFLDYYEQPRLKLAVEVKETAFPYMGLGNRIPLHASQLYLPGGRRGWRGEMRVMAMDYNEERNTITSTMEAKL